MQSSAELRYFWKSAVPAAVESWYRGGILPGGGRTRTDDYLKDPEQKELGIKRRGGEPGVEVKEVEVKGLAGYGRKLSTPFPGRIEIWSKWPSAALTLDGAPVMRITKQRWIRKFDTGRGTVVEIPLDKDEKPKDGSSRPNDGCNLEFTSLTAPSGEVWWTLGFEAFGDLQNVEGNLIATIEHLTAGAPPFQAEMTASYPEWLSRIVRATNL